MQGRKQQVIFSLRLVYKYIKTENKMETQVILKSLTNVLPANLSYSAKSNAFLSNGYVSAANNVYFNAIRFAEGIVIKEDVGEGYAHTFLNGIRIYALESRTLLADKAFHCAYYSKEKVLRESKEMLIELLNDAAERMGKRLNKYEVESMIDRILRNAFETNQIEMAQQQSRYLLNS